MLRRSTAVVFIVAFAALFAPYAALAQPESSAVAALRHTLSGLNIDSPLEDLRKNRSRGDNRFVGINGFRCLPPGLNEKEIGLARKHGLRCLEGTSDMIEGEEHERLLSRAIAYATAYNKALLVELKNAVQPNQPLHPDALTRAGERQR